jgi:hypothetical protein
MCVGAMGSFRARIRVGAWLALAALALNLAVAFGHHHFDAVAAGSHTVAEHASRSGQPSDDHDHHDPAAVDPCLICLVVTAAAIAADAPSLPARDATPVATAAMALAAGAPPRGCTSFEARAPPGA